METRKTKAWLRKHWLPVTVGFLGLVLLAVLAVGSIRRYQASTPIAHIEPDDSLSAFSTTSRLDRYKEEMERINRENIRRQRSLETIVSMDFGRIGEEKTEGEDVSSADQPSLPEPAEAAPPVERRKEAPGKVNRSLPQSAPSTKLQVVEREQETPFYTLKVEAVIAASSEKQKSLYPAVVHGDQQVEANESLCFRLLEDIREGGQLIPRNSLLYGRLTGTGGGRLKVLITTAGPLKMKVYDQDLGEGILYMQEELLPSALAESRDDALDQILVSLPYGGVASGLTGLGRNLVRKNRKRRPAFLADGYPLFVSFDQK